MNRRFQWEDELSIKVDIDRIDNIEDASYFLQGTMPDEKPFKHEIERMRLFYMMNGNEALAQVGCSEVLLDSFEVSEVEGAMVLKVYLKGEEPLSNPVPGIYIAAQEFPEELIF